jgi:hypothetical protein
MCVYLCILVLSRIIRHDPGDQPILSDGVSQGSLLVLTSTSFSCEGCGGEGSDMFEVVVPSPLFSVGNNRRRTHL